MASAVRNDCSIDIAIPTGLQVERGEVGRAGTPVLHVDRAEVILSGGPDHRIVGGADYAAFEIGIGQREGRGRKGGGKTENNADGYTNLIIDMSC